MKKLSIITVCKNEANNIAKTIESVINQTYDNFEYIIIDGDSTDGTKEIIKQYSTKIDKFVSELDTGIFNAQNKGIKHASGEYILLINAGDYLLHDSVLQGIFSLSPNSDFFYGDIIYSLNNGEKYRKKSFKKLSYCSFYVESIPHPCTFIKREVYNNIGLLDESYRLTSDYEFCLRAILKHHCSYTYIPRPISVFNLKGISSTAEHSVSAKDERLRARKNCYPPHILLSLRIFKPIIILFAKKIRYLYYYFLSRISNKFLYGKK